MARPKQFITKDGNLNNFKTVSTSDYSQFQYGTVITGSEYPYVSNISRYHVYTDQNREYVKALRNTLNYYGNISKHYYYDSNLGDKEQQELSLVSIPSIFYGSSIRKGSITCKWYLTGTLIAELQDVNGNGELIQVGPSGSNGSGSVAGVVLYNEGFILLTGSWNLHPTYTDLFGIGLTYYPPSWKYFMHTGSDETNRAVSSSFLLDFEGTTYVPTITMLAHAKIGELNHSNNLTTIQYGQDLTAQTSSYVYSENKQILVNNMVSSSYIEEEPDFLKTTYISKIAIYDEQKNLIGIAKVANPVRKRELDSYTFKLKMDL